jgi:hypothetical protein
MLKQNTTFKEKRFYFGSQFQRFESIVSWPVVFGPGVKTASWQGIPGRAKLLQPGSKREVGAGVLLPSSRARPQLFSIRPYHLSVTPQAGDQALTDGPLQDAYPNLSNGASKGSRPDSALSCLSSQGVCT